MSLQLKKFPMESIPDGSVVVMIGKRNTGKSVLVKDLLYHKQDIPVGTVISGTEGANHFYRNLVPPIFIHHEYRPSIIGNFLKRQKKVVDQMEKEKSTQGYSQIDPRAFLVMDDCLYDQTWTKNPDIRSLFMNGRHHKVLFLLTMQYPLGILPNLRTNIDYVFILREQVMSNKKRIYDHYAGMFPSFEMFLQVMNQCTENYECLVINNSAKSNRLEDQVFWYKADIRTDFKMCAPELWRYSSINYEDDDTGEEDIMTIKKKNTIIVNVKKEY